MKRSVFSVFLLVAMVVAIQSGYAQVEKKKEFSKTYEVSPNATLSISNKFGEVHIETWDQNTIEIQVTVTARKRNESSATNALNQIDIDFSQNSSGVEVETEISGSMNNRSGEKLTIDYEVKMPKSNNLDLKHSYGSLYVDDIEGDVDLKMSYGNMKIQAINSESEIKLSYGNGEIESLQDGELSVSYSNISIEEMGNVDLSSQYSNVDFEKSGDVSLSNRYGSVKINEVNSLKGSSKYGDLKIRRLHQSLVMDLLHGSGVKVDWISNSFNWIDIDASYATNSVLLFQRGFGAELEGYFKYCDLKYDKEEFDFSYVDKGNTSSEYKGRIGSASSSAKILLNSSYGNIRIGYAD